MAYIQLLHPVLEYASASWNTAISWLEVAQRKTAQLNCDIRRKTEKLSRLVSYRN